LKYCLPRTSSNWPTLRYNRPTRQVNRLPLIRPTIWKMLFDRAGAISTRRQLEAIASIYSASQASWSFYRRRGRRRPDVESCRLSCASRKTNRTYTVVGKKSVDVGQNRQASVSGYRASESTKRQRQQRGSFRTRERVTKNNYEWPVAD
jgi:hypothetical protein